MKAYLINLDSRPDRLAESQAEFSRIGLTVERFPATSGENAALSFNDSQYRAIKAGHDSGAECFAVFEDDVMFDGCWCKVGKAMADLPYGWDALYLGCNITTDWFLRPERVSPRLVRLKDAWQSHAIVYSRKGAEYILTQFKPTEFPIFDEMIRSTIMNDGNMYLLDPMICYQRPSFSDIWGLNADYSGCHIMGNHILKSIP